MRKIRQILDGGDATNDKQACEISENSHSYLLKTPSNTRCMLLGYEYPHHL